MYLNWAIAFVMFKKALIRHPTVAMGVIGT